MEMLLSTVIGYLKVAEGGKEDKGGLVPFFSVRLL
jgi:hypothetical protein